MHFIRIRYVSAEEPREEGGKEELTRSGSCDDDVSEGQRKSDLSLFI